ncbi:hypothetical protein [uncultured Stenotrophomonas sp.]|uniref:hypothetical protein n=1 Tax=uncultured Stenotrophomonas sp. TaxID=165438 RepID=UPI00280651AE|nr:hypothetical protein [uncultured Stenotrophomonas sp.]
MSNTTNDAHRAQAQLDATGEALRVTLERITALPPAQVIPYLSSVVQIGIELLRANGREDAYVKGFLEAALGSLDSPPTIMLKDLRDH